MVLAALLVACRLATCPTSRSPAAVKPTTDGVVRAPSAFGITLISGRPSAPVPSRTDTHELVVPRSIPMILPIHALARPQRGGHTSSVRQDSPTRVVHSAALSYRGGAGRRRRGPSCAHAGTLCERYLPSRCGPPPWRWRRPQASLGGGADGDAGLATTTSAGRINRPCQR